MNLVEDIANAYEEIGKTKAIASNYHSNFYVPLETAQAWVNREEFFLHTENETSFVFKKDGDFYHLYYTAPSLEALNRALENLLDLDPMTLVSDIVGRKEDLEEVVELFVNHGFQERNILIRMTKIAEESTEDYSSNSQEEILASKEDTDAIVDILNSSFDQYSEQIPTAGDIREAIGKKDILLLKREKNIAGLLFFNLTGLSSTLRYWFVSDAFRGRGIGSIMMHRYFYDCRTAKRFILWVDSNNNNAIAPYLHYGYTKDGLVDHIMFRKGGS